MTRRNGWARATVWSPWRASAAHADLHDPVWSSRNGHESQFVELASISWTRLLATLDLIGSLAHLLDSHVSPFGPFPVARAAVEASGRTAWLAETELSARDRAGRALADRCESLGFQWTAASAVEAELEAGALHERFSERVRFWGHEPIVTTEGRVTGIRGYPYPAKHEAAALVHPHGEVLYRWLSALVHVDPVRAFNEAMRAEDPGPGSPFRSVLAVQAKAGTVAVLVEGVFTSFTAAFEGVANYYGWDLSRWRSAKVSSAMALQRALP